MVAFPLAALAVLGPARSKAAGKAPVDVAASKAVVLLVPPTQDAMTSAAAARVQGELTAAGFHVSIVPLGEQDARRDLETAASELRPIAAFAIFMAPPDDHGDSAAEIWVSDRIRQKVVIQRADLKASERDRGAEILAVRAVELLRASLAEFWLPTPAPEPPPSPPPLREKPSAPPRESARLDAAPAHGYAEGLGASLGLAVLQSFEGGDPVWAPLAMVSYGWAHGLSARAAFFAVEPPRVVTATGGTADVEEQFMELEAAKTWWPRARVVPFVAVGAGAAHLHATGHGTPPNQGRTADAWSLLTTAGLGVGIPFAKYFSAVAQARAAITWPPDDLMIAGADAGRAAAPSLLFDANVLATLP